MKQYKKDFIKFLLDNNALKFGDFTLKSGRKSPYFLNTGMLFSGEGIYKLGKFYAETICDNIETDKYSVIFGPAYKGIPLAISTVSALYNDKNINKSYTFNRKEVKDHGDKGLFVGKQLNENDKIIIVDDVITAGTAIKESLELLKSCASPSVTAVVISVDRMEKGANDKSAIQEIEDITGIKFLPIVTIVEIIDFLKDEIKNNNNIVSSELLSKMEKYRKIYGV